MRSARMLLASIAVLATAPACSDQACLQWSKADGPCPSREAALAFMRGNPNAGCGSGKVVSVDSDGELDGQACCYEVTESDDEVDLPCVGPVGAGPGGDPSTGAGPAGECGDGVCSPSFESCAICPADCGQCACGNGTCDPGETCVVCPEDCGACGCVLGPEGCASCAQLITVAECAGQPLCGEASKAALEAVLTCACALCQAACPNACTGTPLLSLPNECAQCVAVECPNEVSNCIDTL